VITLVSSVLFNRRNLRGLIELLGRVIKRKR